MTELPERIWCIASTARYGMWYDSAAPVHVEYLRADTAVTKAEAMVAAAYEAAAQNCYGCEHLPDELLEYGASLAGEISTLTPADARAALNKIVQEAVEAERSRWAKTSREDYEAFCAMRNAINEVIGDMPSAESALLAGPELAHEMEQVAEAVCAFAAIRAPQEPSE